MTFLAGSVLGEVRHPPSAERETRVVRVQKSIRRAEIHWYEAHGIGKRDFKIKRYLD